MEGKGKAQTTPIGHIPTLDGLDVSGLNMKPEDLEILLAVERKDWLGEIPSISEFYDHIGRRCPKELRSQVEALRVRLTA